MAPALSPRHRWAAFDALGVEDLYALLRLRNAVFVVEQRCAFAEIDGRDPEALHLLAWGERGGPLSGCLRVFAPGRDGPHARIGRVATSPASRGQGLGRWMMLEALATIDRRFGPAVTEIGAQIEAEPFYARLGFERASDPYDEDGIAHCTMVRQSQAGRFSQNTLPSNSNTTSPC